MADALRYHVMEGEDLQKLNNQLSITNKQLIEEKDLNSIIIKEKIMQSKKQNDKIKELQNKVMSMEYTLSHIVREFDQEKEIISKLAKKEIDKVRYTVDTLKSELNIRIRQMKQIKRIAQHILDQRTDLETFFMDALEHVRLEICREKEEKRKREAEEYNKKIRSVLNPKKNSTDDSEEELEEVKEKPKPVKVDITQLSWKDKERVLRVLFAKMNGIAMQGSDGDEENKISGDDYQLNENVRPGEGEGEESEESESEESGEEESEESEEGSEEEGGEEGEEKEEEEEDEDNILELIEEEEPLNKEKEEEDRTMIERIKQQQQQQKENKMKQSNEEVSKLNNDSIRNPHPPLEEPLNKEMITDTSPDTELIENESDDEQYIASAKEIMKSDESLEKYIEDEMENCQKSEEELRAQSKESFDEFLKRSLSNMNNENENENENQVEDINNANINTDETNENEN
ncbi:hypothetical protein BCR32DRAFT_242164 [Anaeromyces robustus]|uniref:Uncharacterized protein n=1 Tax=Anaeromyces robustus TaxID=1754192 RepID=A0A1Y1XGQ7_9FUNG|nr:hypothetical protein BCR32DRAFT_242164 [Anaeromyces robustus]|eukprot:ORX84940.1 hypothetical protein BCR32DRAFT_242164 [Anaeromyces robustus]